LADTATGETIASACDFSYRAFLNSPSVERPGAFSIYRNWKLTWKTRNGLTHAHYEGACSKGCARSVASKFHVETKLRSAEATTLLRGAKKVAMGISR
jgi:hypothetical protein